ncbi:MAG: hypothetical protein ABIF85_07865, partial [Nanoarchaeota archaeon]
NWTGLAEGVYYYNATAYDNAGNVNYAETRKITLDTTSPTVSLDSPANNSWSQTNAISFTYTPSDTNLNSCDIYHNASGWQTNATNSSLLAGVQSAFAVTLSDGSYIWNINCTDLAGNSAFNATNYTIMIDAALPTVSFGSATAAHNSYFNRNWIYANVTVVETNEANITFALYNTTLVNSTNSTSGLRAINWTNLASNMRYYYNITVYDYAANTQSTETRRLTLDSTAPSANITSPSNNSNTTDPTPLIRFNLTDNLAEIINYSVYVNGTANGQSGTALGIGNFTLNGLELGVWRIKLNALDEASNAANSSEIFVTIAPPAVYLASPIDNYFTSSTAINFTFNVSDPENDNLNCSLYINGAYNRSNTTTANFTNTVFSVAGLAEGNGQEWLVHCINPANNTGNNTKAFNVDLTYPTISYGANTKADNAFTNNPVFVNVSAYDLNEANITFRLYNLTSIFNKTAYTSQARSITWAVPDGIYYYNTTIVDIVGHSNTTQTRAIIVDTAAPKWSGNATSNSSGTYYFNITWADTYINTVVIEHNFTGTLANYTASNISNVYSYGYSVGGSTYQYRWYANDSAGNANSSNLWIIALSDITAPVITIVSPVNGTVLAAGTMSTTINSLTNENATCRYSANSSFAYADGTNFTITGNASHSFAYSVANGNTYSLYYLCNDTSGNINSQSMHHTFSVASADAAAPSSGGGGGGGGITAAQNKTNQTVANATIIAPAIVNNTNETVEPSAPEEYPYKTKAYEKINEVKQKISAGDIKAKEKITEAENAYATGDYSKAYDLAIEAEGLIGPVVPEESKTNYAVYAITAAVLILGGYAVKAGLLKLNSKHAIKAQEIQDIPKKQETIPAKPEFQEPMWKSVAPAAQNVQIPQDDDLDDIEKRLEEIRRKLRE